MKQNKRILAAIVGASILQTGISCYSASTAKEITVKLDGTKISFDVEPQIIDGRTMVPLRKIFEEIGALVKWDSETKTVSARKSSKTVTLTIDSADLNIDNGDTDADGNAISETVQLEVPAQIISGRTLVPARAVSEAFGLDVDWDEKSQTVIITSASDDDESWKENMGTINLTDMTYTGEGVATDGNQIVISAGGDFTVTGTMSDGSIKISADDKVKLRLSGASVTSSDGPCIYVEDADKAYITITADTDNTLIAENSENGAIYSRDKLEIKGNGALSIFSPAGHGIKVSDNLTIENGNITIDAFNDGIHVDDTFKMTGGNVTIGAVGDGIDSESIVMVSGGELSIETTGVPIENESDNAQENNAGADMGRHFGGMREESTDVEFEKSTKGINAEWMMKITGGKITINSASHAIHCQDEIEISGAIFKLSSEYEKGISAHGSLTISGEDTVIDVTKSTEGLESKNILTINDGDIKLVSSDDGINATGGSSGEMMMPGGGRQDNKGFQDRTEGIENRGEKPNSAGDTQTPNGDMPHGGRENRKNMSVGDMTPPEMPDDMGDMTPPYGEEIQRPENEGGIPQGGFGGSGGMGKNMSDCLVINGGNIEIFAEDDCLDSNGNLVINGGVIKAVKENGSFTGPNSVFDADGSVTISEEVTIIAAGSGGIQSSLNISQNSITVYTDSAHSAGDIITLSDSKGNVISEYAPSGNFTAVLITSPEIETGKTYTVTIEDETHSIEVTEQSTVVGTKTSNIDGDRGMGGGRNNGQKDKS